MFLIQKLSSVASRPHLKNIHLNNLFLCSYAVPGIGTLGDNSHTHYNKMLNIIWWEVRKNEESNLGWGDSVSAGS
jgi:hypothetical protein